jgi:hypothetical protein
MDRAKTGRAARFDSSSNVTVMEVMRQRACGFSAFLRGYGGGVGVVLVVPIGVLLCCLQQGLMVER